MYNLFVSGNCSAWQGEPYEYELARCLRAGEYSDEELAAQYQALSAKDIEFLIELPCLFAYEDHCQKDARLGKVLRIRKKDGQVRIDYKIANDAPSLSPQMIHKLAWDLGVGNWEMNRTHWAIKSESLVQAFAEAGFPNAVNEPSPETVDITKHTFDIALSFPGEERSYVESVARELAKLVLSSKIFYDNNYKAQLARPNLDILLQDIYRNRSKLIVAFLCNAYAEKQWAESNSVRSGISLKLKKKSASCLCVTMLVTCQVFSPRTGILMPRLIRHTKSQL